MKLLTPSEYQPRADSIFEEVKQTLSRRLPFARIEHIGSSAVRGALSKGDLDIFVGVPKAEYEKSLKIVQRLGFSIKEDTLRTSSLCMLVTEAFDFDVALQLVELGSDFEHFLVFRDRMNADEHLVAEYNKLKENAAKLSIDEYRDRKNQFIRFVLAKWIRPF